MAVDKLVDSTKLDAALEATADAIREKTGDTDDIAFDLATETGFAEAVASIPSGGSILLYEADITIDDNISSVSLVAIAAISTGLSRRDLVDDAHILALESTYMGDISSLPPEYCIKTINIMGCNSDNIELKNLDFLFYLRNKESPPSRGTNRRALSGGRGFLMTGVTTDLSTLNIKAGAATSSCGINSGVWRLRLYDLGIKQIL